MNDFVLFIKPVKALAYDRTINAKKMSNVGIPRKANPPNTKITIANIKNPRLARLYVLEL